MLLSLSSHSNCRKCSDCSSNEALWWFPHQLSILTSSIETTKHVSVRYPLDINSIFTLMTLQHVKRCAYRGKMLDSTSFVVVYGDLLPIAMQGV